MRFKERNITRVESVLPALRKQRTKPGPLWFRGHGRADWTLLPKLARPPVRLTAEIAHLKRFQQNASTLVEAPGRIGEAWEWMFLMQHHGAYTRLLDWSENPLVALYFAVREGDNAGEDGAIWCLDPIALNTAANVTPAHALEIPAFGYDAVLENYLPSRVQDGSSGDKISPLAIIGPRNNRRMVAQLGTFTISHSNQIAIEKVGKGKHVWKWIIPKASKAAILADLRNLGYSELTLFPDLDRVASLSLDVFS